MKTTGRKAKIVVSGDGAGVVCQAGGLLLVETLRATGLDQGLTTALQRWRAPWAVHTIRGRSQAMRRSRRR